MNIVEKIISNSLKLVTRENRPDTVVDVDGVEIGGVGIVVISGPCSVESREQVLETAREVKEAGAHMLRGGAFKPRTSPYSFQGLKEEGLMLLAEAREVTGLPVVTEIISPNDLELVSRYADVLQVGARNMQNYPLLRALGRSRKPVLLKRGHSSTVNEWLNAAEYILDGGNGEVILCERGIRTFEVMTRFTLDLSVVPALKKLCHLPIVVDPSHGTGRRSLVPSMSKAAVAAGADGLLIEVHNEPDKALCDGPQSLFPDQFNTLMNELELVTRAMGRSL